ncbi:hypothetical protein [Leifsonia sp. fls2-241-R2A-40a]|uniref:hypothetical protein n=1 Tax=Leifsonia sp. fls2-241-R2A-40a TaxID=3040290 RepID=UPI00255143C1|nr:hypothetical protein [Leifsonia sp. fls2-241-R2A-40a]
MAQHDGSNGPPLEWLPPHQRHAVFTLGQVDDHIDKVGDMLFAYLKDGPLELTNERVGDSVATRVVAVRPLPEGVARSVADALTQLRAVLEHTLFAQVEHEAKRRLTEQEASAIEMPATTAREGFDGWLNNGRHNRRKFITSSVIERVRALQPAGTPDPKGHPLAALATYTNHAKHRAPAVAATLLGAVVLLVPGPVRLASGPDRPLRRGDTLMTVPNGVILPADIWPKVSIQQPKLGTWAVVMQELQRIEDWVRTVAIPIIVTGETDVEELPPGVDVTIAHSNFAEAVRTAQRRPAAARHSQRLQLRAVRESLPGTLAASGLVGLREAAAWSETADDELVAKFADLAQRVRDDDTPTTRKALSDHILEMAGAAAAT